MLPASCLISTDYLITINKILTIYSCNLLLHSNNELKAVEDRSDPEHEERATLPKTAAWAFAATA